MDGKFTEDDKQKAIDFLNFVTKHAKFKLTVTENIELFKLLNWAQTSLVPKINSNILEVKRVVEPEKPAAQAKPRRGKAK